MNSRVIKELFSYLLKGEPGKDYKVVFVNKNKVRVSSLELERQGFIQSLDIDLENTMLLGLILFIGNETSKVIKEYFNIAKKASILNMPIYFVLDDCDDEFIAFTSVIKKLVDLMPTAEPWDIIKIAELVVLLKRYLNTLKKSRNAKSEKEYLDYQVSMETVIQLLHELEAVSKKLDRFLNVENIVELTHEIQPTNLTNAFEQLLRRDSITVSGVYSTSHLLGSCIDVPSERLRGILLKFSERGKFAFIIAPFILSSVLKYIIPDETMIVI